MDIKIRNFTNADAEVASHIIERNLSEINCKDYSIEVIDFMKGLYTPEYLINAMNKRHMIVALDGSEIIGISALEENVIYTVFVNPDYHGKGIGAMLMKEIENYAQSKGINLVILYASLSAHEFYSKLGYEKIDIEEDENFGKAHKMAKSLV